MRDASTEMVEALRRLEDMTVDLVHLSDAPEEGTDREFYAALQKRAQKGRAVIADYVRALTNYRRQKRLEQQARAIGIGT